MPRRPIASENEPQKLGASPWTIMYTVTVKVVNDIETPRSYSLVSLLLGCDIIELVLNKTYFGNNTQGREVDIGREGRKDGGKRDNADHLQFAGSREDMVWWWLRGLAL